MVLLKIKGPRRRESERVKSKPESHSPIEDEEPAPVPKSKPSTKSTFKSGSSVSTGSGTNVTPRKDSTKISIGAMSPGDTIEVHHRPSKSQPLVDLQETSPDVGPLYEHERVMSPVGDSEPVVKKTSTTIDPSPVRPAGEEVDGDAEMLDPVRSPVPQRAAASANVSQDDAVVEYDMRHDKDHGDSEDDGRDTMWYKQANKPKFADDVIMISSDDDRDDENEGWDLNYRPWKNYDEKMRYQWELMYCNVTNYPMEGDWGTTELYQHEKDKEMLRYMEDFPLSEWVLPRDVVSDAYNRLLERTKWRNLGARIYGQQRLPGWNPSSAQPIARSHGHSVQAQPSPTGRAHHQPRDASFTSRSPHGMPPPSQQPGMVGGMAQHLPQHTVFQPTPPQVLRSQPNAHPVPTYPNGLPVHSAVARPSYQAVMPPGAAATGAVLGQMAYPSMQNANGMYPPPPMSNSSSAYVPKRSRRKKAQSPAAEDSQLPPPVPPYPAREKPNSHASKGGRRSMRRAAEAAEFPWNRDLDFVAAKNNATWDESIYDAATLTSMEQTRVRNEAVIARIDQAESERQRRTRAKRKADKEDGSSEMEQTRGGRRKSSIRLAGDAAIGDPYHSGIFEFAPKDQPKLAALGDKTPNEILEAVEEGELTLDDVGDITICWNPGKKAITQDLEQARFSIKDTLLTRQQLAQMPVLIRRAAECIVDFCPDMLWRGMLLRIASEAGYGNKQVRDRMCLNGNYCDKATITKRIGSALGQKQQPTIKRNKKLAEPVSSPPPGEEKIKGYTKGEEEYYNENVEDFGHYVTFFGHRASHRSQLQLSQSSSKRKASAMDATEGVKLRASSSRAKNVEETTQSPEAMEVSDEAESSAAEEGEEGEGGDVSDADAVSIQSDTILDEMDDD